MAAFFVIIIPESEVWTRPVVHYDPLTTASVDMATQAGLVISIGKIITGVNTGAVTRGDFGVRFWGGDWFLCGDLLRSAGFLFIIPD